MIKIKKEINKKKYIISLSIVLIGILSLITGTSFALLKGNNQDTNEQIIKTGSIELKLTENYETINKKVSIMGDEEGLLQEDIYEFKIENTGSYPAKYDLKLLNEVPSTYTGKVLDTKYIKVGLEINGEEYGPMSLEKVKNIIDSDVIYKNEVLNYKLRIWLDKSKEEEISKLEDYKAFLKLRIEAEQRPESMETKDSAKTFNYTGEPQEYTVPRNGYYYVELGGGAGYEQTTGGYDSGGAKTSGYIYLKAREKLYIYVGGKGTRPDTNCRTSGYEFNGGGVAKPAKSGICGGTGGSATDIRLKGGSWDNTESLISRIMVAGGGAEGDSGSGYTLGYGGTLYGTKTIFSTYQQYLSSPGTQTSGGAAPTKYSGAQSNGEAGSFGKGGAGGASNASATTGSGSGGGSGYYGASGSSGLSNGTWSASGGSSYISGYAGVNSVKESTTITHTNQTIHYSGKYFVGGKMLEGENTGDGYAKITYVDTKPKKRTTKLNNVRYIKDCTNYNSSNNANHWVELQAIKDGVNVAKGKTATGTTAESSANPYSRITDGDITYSSWANASSSTNNQCVTIDLEETYDLDEIAVWNYFGDVRTYYDSVTSVSSDNKTFTQVIDEANVQDSNGRRINAYTENINGYVQENLKLWYDGYANSGSNHLTVLSSWKDLSGTGYNGTISSGTWKTNNLLLPSTTVTSSMPLSSVLTPTTNSTLSITMMANSVPYTNTTYGNTGVLIGGVHYSGQAIFWQNSKANQMKVYAGIRTTSGLAGADFNEHTAPTKIINFTMVNDVTNNKLTSYINGIKVKESTSIGGSYEYTSNIGNLGINKAQIYSGSGTTNAINMNTYSAKVYTKALTSEEVLHNYKYDQQHIKIN